MEAWQLVKYWNRDGQVTEGDRADYVSPGRNQRSGKSKGQSMTARMQKGRVRP